LGIHFNCFAGFFLSIRFLHKFYQCFLSAFLPLPAKLTTLIRNTIVRYDTEFQIPSIQNKLSSVDKNVLAHKILCLPNNYMTILFLKYYFRLDEGSISRIAEEPYVTGCLHYTNELICFAMGMPDGSYIHEDTMRSACRITMNRYCNHTMEIGSYSIPHYSNRFKRNLKMLPSAQTSNNLIVVIGKRVAMFALVALLSFATTLAVNADIRERFFNWVRNTFPQFSEFGAANSTVMLDDYSIEKLATFKPDYIPVGFTLSGEPYFSPTTMMYDYTNDRNEIISFRCQFPTGSLTAYDTEGAIVDEIEYKGQSAFTWQNKGFTYLVWQQEGYECSIAANLSKDEVFRIANSVKSFG